MTPKQVFQMMAAVGKASGCFPNQNKEAVFEQFPPHWKKYYQLMADAINERIARAAQ